MQRRWVIGCAVAATAAFALGGVPSSSATGGSPQPLSDGSARPLITAFAGVGADPVLAQRVYDAGARFARFYVNWSSIAPATLPGSWDPTDPSDPHYDWSAADAAVQQMVAHGLEPLVGIESAPLWAQQAPASLGPANKPDAAALGQFATAIGRHFDGSLPGVPRVRYWQVWNEPNLSLDLVPQFENGQPFSPGLYRAMVNAMAASLKAVDAGNVIVAGGTAPFRDLTPAVTAVDADWGPLAFMRNVLCLSPTLQPTCSDPVHFDVWATHPYASGGPNHHAALPNDVSLADLPKMRSVLFAAQAVGHIVSTRPVELWATEFNWDSSPPDPNGVPTALLTRWVAEALFRMWQDGVSLVTWFSVRDQDLSTLYQSGMYYRGATVADDTPKPSLDAFRFPFVAFAQRSHVSVWGRTPASAADSVTVEQSTPTGWQTLGTLSANAFGIFRGTFAGLGRGDVRARDDAAASTSPAFSLAPVPDQYFTPFGGPPLEPVVPVTRPALPAATPGAGNRAAIQRRLP